MCKQMRDLQNASQRRSHPAADADSAVELVDAAVNIGARASPERMATGQTALPHKVPMLSGGLNRAHPLYLAITGRAARPNSTTVAGAAQPNLRITKGL
jgi:hypothetical protein